MLKLLSDNLDLWNAAGILPTEQIDELSNYDRGHRMYGMESWTDMFTHRQLYSLGVVVEAWYQVLHELQEEGAGQLKDLDKAALTYLTLSIDKLVNFNCKSTRWDVNRCSIVGKFDSHNYSMKWSFAEMAPAVTGRGLDWVLGQTTKALGELQALAGTDSSSASLFNERAVMPSPEITLGSADSLSIPNHSVDSVVIDPPYYDNVMYAELSDFFYVWLKRTAGLIYPNAFSDYLTDKDREAVANSAKFKGEKGGAKKLAGRDYQERMGAIFTECRRVIKPHGVMTVMFTHKASGAWDALATGLVKAGWVITASWPINTEAEGSLHIKEKSAAKSTIFLVCRPRETPLEDADEVYWEEVEPRVKEAVRLRVAEFQEAGIGGVDLYLASFGPALQVFSENWPLKRGRPIQKPRELALFPDEEFDPYAVQPEDALDAARGEVKRWRMEQLATVKRKHHLDPLTEFFVLAWDAFKAPRFPVDEALKLARVVGLDFDQQVKNQVCEVKSSDVILWDSKTRKSKGKLGPMGDTCMLNTLHQAAAIVRDQNTGAAQKAIEDNGLLEDATLLTALEALLNVLPAVANPEKAPKLDANLSGASSDFEALEKLRKLAFAEQVPEPARQLLLPIEETTLDDESGEE